MASIANVKLGPCSVNFNNVDLGHTKGGVSVSYEPNYYDVTVDKYGETVTEKVLVGETLKITVPLAEFTLSNLEVAIPAGTDAGPNNRVTIGKDAGERMAQYGAQLVLHPLANDASDRSEDVVLHKAIVAESVEIKHANDGEKLVEVVFQALLDETKSSGNRLGFIGDSVD